MPKKNGKITQADLNQYESRVPNQGELRKYRLNNLILAFMKLDDDNYGLKSDAKNPSPSAVNTATPLQKQSFEGRLYVFVVILLSFSTTSADTCRRSTNRSTNMM